MIFSSFGSRFGLVFEILNFWLFILPFWDISAFSLYFPKIQNLNYNCMYFRHFLFRLGRVFDILVPNFHGFAGFLYCVDFFLVFRSKSLNILVLFVIYELLSNILYFLPKTVKHTIRV